MWEPRPLTALWAFTACYSDSFTPRFGGPCLKKPAEAGDKLCRLVSGFLLDLTLWPWGWRYISAKRRSVCRLHGVMTHKIVLFIVTATRTANETIRNLFSRKVGNVDVRSCSLQPWCGITWTAFCRPYSVCFLIVNVAVQINKLSIIILKPLCPSWFRNVAWGGGGPTQVRYGGTGFMGQRNFYPPFVSLTTD
jgi:hypothetical protein